MAPRISGQSARVRSAVPADDGGTWHPGAAMSPDRPSDDIPEAPPDDRAARGRGFGRLRRDRGPSDAYVEDATDTWVRMLTPTEDDERRLPLRRLGPERGDVGDNDPAAAGDRPLPQRDSARRSAARP